MSKKDDFQFSYSVLVYPLLFVFALWVVFWAEVKFGIRFSEYGIYPQQISGLKGIVLSPFIHSDISHLYNNSLPLLVLIAALRYFYREDFYAIIIWGVLGSGLITWVIGRPSYHIGASGLIYALVSFVFFKGIKSKHYRLVALSFFVVLVYGGLVWYIFPSVQNNISWEGHLGGFLIGFILSFLFKKLPIAKDRVYDWEQENYNPDVDPFMRQFDETGHFFEMPTQTLTQDIEIVYEFIPKEENDNEV